MADDFLKSDAPAWANSSDRTGASGSQFGAWVGARYADGRVVRLSPDNGFFYQACVHPRGTQALYSGALSGPPRIWLVDLDPLGTPSALTPEDSGARHPVWSWDGSRIVFTSDRSTSGDSQPVEEIPPQGMPSLGNIFVMAPDGSGVTQLTFGDFADQRPTFSPDGSTIVFVSNREGRLGLWRVRADGTDDPEPLPYRAMGYRPWFGVGGDRLYFFTQDGDRHRVATAELDTDAAEFLDNDDQGWTHGTFADPNGEVLIVHSTRIGGKYQLFEIPLDGAPMRPIEIDGVPHPMHGTRSHNGVITFDVAV
jgi:dipeptidyl aminopeptidase/acylaminoacyl peptidase